MRAIVITRPGPPEVLAVGDVATPEPGARQVRIRVHAAGVNRADLMQRRGSYPAPPGWPADIPGLEYAGVVDALGPEASRWSVGTRVMGLVGGGAYAEQVVAHEDEVLPLPDRLSFAAGAAIPEVFITAHDAVFTQMRLAAGEVLLIHAVGGGVGTAALQLARARGARVLGTGRTPWKLGRAGELGLDVAINVAEEDFAEAALRETGGRGVDGVLDLVGGGYLAGNLRAMATLGRLLVVGLVAGRSAELDMGTLLRKRLRIFGTALRSRPQEEKIAAARAFERDALPLLADGTVRPILDRTLPLTEAAAAHEALESNETFGKVVLLI